MTKLSDYQRAFLERLVSLRVDRLIRFSGGFWSYPEAPLDKRGAPPPGLWVDVRTIRALEKAGLLVRLNRFPEEWRDERGLVKPDLPLFPNAP